MKGKAFAGALALCLALTIGAGAQGHSLEAMGLRLYAPQGWQVITPANIGEAEGFLGEMGAEADTVLAQMENTGAGALVYAPDMEARLTAGPQCDIDSVWQADEAGRARIAALAKEAYPALEGGWLNGGWLLFTGEEMMGQMPVYHRVYVTCHYGRLYALEAVRYGSAFTAENEADLEKMAGDTVVLGVKQAAGAAESEIPALELPAHSGTAEVRVSRDETPITLDNPYTHVVSPFVLTGTTTPKAELRYYVGGAGVARFESDEEGRFEVEIKNLSRGKNAIRIQSVSDAGYGAVVFNCQYTPATAPVALAALPETVTAESHEVRGRALPGTEVTIIRGTRAHETVKVGEDGLFTLTAKLDRQKAYEFTLRAEHPDYRRSETEFTLKRVPTPQEQAKTVNYDRLMKKPADFKDAVTLLSGRVTGMGNGPQTGAYLIFDEKYILLTGDLYGVQEGPAQALVRFTGRLNNGLAEAQLITLD